MYNTRNSGGKQYNIRNSEKFCEQQQQQQQTTPLVPTCVTPLKTIEQAQDTQQPIEDVSGSNSQTSVQIPVNQSSETETSVAQDNQNNVLKAEDIQSIEESNTGKTEMKWSGKRKINKKEQKKRLNARMRRLVCPKSPLMVFSELYKDTPIKLKEQLHNNYLIYTASIEVDGEVYTGSHVSKTQAKQKACESFLRIVLEKKMSEPPPEKKQECTEETNMEVSSENGKSAKPSKGPPMEDFPWPHFVSLAMHNLISHWELHPATPKVMQKETYPKVAKIGGMKKFPDHPESYNPVQLLHQMTPGITFKETTTTSKNTPVFEVLCEINSIPFKGHGTTKKGAKKECAIAVIKHFWNFDFHANHKTI